MARNTSGKQRNVPQTNENTSPDTPRKYTHDFINVYLDKNDTTWLAEHDADAYAIIGEFMDKVSSLHELNVREDAKSGKWNAMYKCSDGESPNDGLILSVRARTFFDALFALSYTIVVKYPGAWRNGSTSSDSRFN